jgi:hypothetical protein
MDGINSSSKHCLKEEVKIMNSLHPNPSQPALKRLNAIEKENSLKVYHKGRDNSSGLPVIQRYKY